MSQRDIKSVEVCTKKLATTQYHLATFEHALSKQTLSQLPLHIIEEYVGPRIEDEYRKTYENASHMRRDHHKNQNTTSQPPSQKEQQTKAKKNREYDEDKNPVLKFEEKLSESAESNKQPIKYHGFRQNQKSADRDTQIPNYALLIFDKKKNVFRMVPIQDHVKFQKVKPEHTVQPAVVNMPMAAPALPVEEAKKPGPKAAKKESNLSKYRNDFLKNVNANNKGSIIGQKRQRNKESLGEATKDEIENEKKRKLKNQKKNAKKKKKIAKQSDDEEVDCDVKFDDDDDDGAGYSSDDPGKKMKNKRDFGSDQESSSEPEDSSEGDIIKDLDVKSDKSDQKKLQLNIKKATKKFRNDKLPQAQQSDEEVPIEDDSSGLASIFSDDGDFSSEKQSGSHEGSYQGSKAYKRSKK